MNRYMLALVLESIGLGFARRKSLLQTSAANDSALRRPRSQPSYLSRFSYQAPPEKASIQSALSYTTNHPTPPLPTTQLANRYISVAYTHIQARYGCFDWPAIRNWHENREGICLARPMLGAGQGEDQRRLLASFFLWLCYGYGARLTEDEHLEGAVSHEVSGRAPCATMVV